jgi:integrating conjugative element protein (TIGR03749 family)
MTQTPHPVPLTALSHVQVAPLPSMPFGIWSGLAVSLAVVLLLAAPFAWAQVEVKPVRERSNASPAVALTPAPSQPGKPPTESDALADLDLGLVSGPQPVVPAVPSQQRRPAAGPSSLAGPADKARGPTLGSARHARSQHAIAPAAQSGAEIERLVFDRRPLSVALPVERERLITFSGPVAMHLPEDADAYLRLQIIGNTVYAKALVPFGSVRVVAELLEGDGLQIPLDLVANAGTASAGSELLVLSKRDSLRAPAGGPAGMANEGVGVQPVPATDESDGVDAVTLTRHAARQLYAPLRLASAHSAIHQVPIVSEPVLGLYRGARARFTPIGAWRSGGLWVTAVRMTNLEPQALEVRLEALRGRWITSAAQHGVLGRAGAENDTTALYLVCDQPFEACR